MAGPRLRRVDTFECGTYPEVAMFHLNISCNHCESPACVANCPTGAMYKDDDGTVQHDDEKCIGCQYCVQSCPYSVPQYLEEQKMVHKCDACYVLRQNGEQPACVAACPMRALEFGVYDDLIAAHPDAVDQIAILPDSSQTGPHTLIDARPAALENDFRKVIL